MKRARRDPIVLGLLLILAVCAIPGVVPGYVLLIVSAVVVIGVAWRAALLNRAG